MKTNYFLTVLFIALFAVDANAQLSFTEIAGTTFPPLVEGEAHFADFDNDNDLDLILSGAGQFDVITRMNPPTTTIYQNDGLGNFTQQTGLSITSLTSSSISVGDIDNDSDLDIFINGMDDSRANISQIYRNDGSGNFSLTSNTIIGFYQGDSEFGDIDSDGDLDLIVSGNTGSGINTSLYVNDGSGNFSLMSGTPFSGTNYASVKFLDIDSDTDLDVVISGTNGSTTFTQLYTNNGTGTYTLVNGTPFRGAQLGSIDAADVDNDNDLDILIAGFDGSTTFTELYINDGSGNYTLKTGTSFRGVAYASVQFADFNVDGAPDFIISGYNGVTLSRYTLLYLNNGAGSFTEMPSTPFPSNQDFKSRAADIDGDGDPDFYLSGSSNGSRNPDNAILYKNNVSAAPVAPVISSVSVPTNATYIAGQDIDFTVNFNENVTVDTASGSPQLGVTIGATTRQAVYQSGSGTGALVFRYTVQVGDVDTDGIAIGTLAANGGTLRDAAGNDADLTLNNVGSTTSVLVDAVAPVITSVAVPANGSYSEGQNIDFNVTFSEAVDIITTEGIPQIAINIGGITRQASYVIGSGNSVVGFRYVVQSGETDTDGIEVGTLATNGGAIRDSAGNNANLTLNNVGSTTGVLVDTTAPSITSVVVPANSTYITGQDLNFTVNFNESVNLTGSPQLAITVGSVVRQATFKGGSGTASLLFGYMVQAGELDTDGISIGAFVTNGGAIRDAAGNDANLTLNNVGSTSSVFVDTTPPAITSVSVPANATYTAGENLDFTVNFNENITVDTGSGSPQITITLGTTARQAVYQSGSGTGALVFRYTIQVGDIDTDGIAVGTLAANGGTIRDAAGNDADLTLNNVGVTTGVLVDAPATLTVTGLSATDKPYDGSTVASVTGTAVLSSNVQPGDDVTLTGTPVYTFASADTGIAIAISTTGFSLSGADAGKYTLAQPVLSADITARPVTITAQTQSKVYGIALTLDNTAFTVTDLDGDSVLPNGELIDAVSLSSATGVDANTLAVAATYPNELVISSPTGSNGFDAINYSLTYVAGDLIVNPRPITITAQTQSKVYGIALTLDNTAFTVTDLDGDSVLPNGELIDAVSLSSASGVVASTAVAATYPNELVISSPTGSNGFSVENYSLTYVAGDFVINPRSITITAQAQSKVYGTTLALDNTAFSITDLDSDSILPNGELIDAVSLSSASGIDVSTMASVNTFTDDLVISSLTGSNGFSVENYSLTYVAGDFIVNPRPITINAQAQSKVYGTALTLDNTAFTVTDLDSDSILPNGESIDAVSISSATGVDVSTTAATGTYADELIISSPTGSNGFSVENYSLTYVSGDLVVTPAVQTGLVFADNSFTYDGSVKSLTVMVLASDATVTYTNNDKINAGTYAVTATVTRPNYTTAVLNATLTINKAAAVITANTVQTFTYDGTIKNVSASLNHTETTLTYTPQQGYTNAGSYAITVSAAETDNYLAASENVSLVIEPATQTGLVFANNSFTYDGSVKSLAVSGLAFDATVTYTNNDNINAGTYAVTATVSRPNYTTAVLNATLTINKAAAVITANAVQTFTYDGTIKNVSASLNHTETTLTYNPQQGYTNAGSYAITVSAAETNNYAATSRSIQLVINKAAQAITFNALATRRLENDPDFQLSATASSGLPVTYSYTFTSPQPAATVSPTGFVDLQTSGQIQITAAQPGNANYQAAPSVQQSLNITSSNAVSSSITIDGQVYNNPPSLVYYLIDCDNGASSVDVSLATEANAQVSTGSNFSIATPTPGVYRQQVVITSQDGTQTRNYMIMVEKAFDFDAIIVQKYNNTLVVNNNPQTNDGYSFVSYKWYKNGRLVGQQQSFSEGDNASDRLDPNATYQAVMVTTSGDELRTCVSRVQLSATQGLSLLQNPVAQGAALKAIAQFPEEELKTALFHVYDTNGRLLLTAPVTGIENNIQLPDNLPVGVYKLILITDQRSEFINFLRK